MSIPNVDSKTLFNSPNFETHLAKKGKYNRGEKTPMQTLTTSKDTRKLHGNDAMIEFICIVYL